MAKRETRHGPRVRVCHVITGFDTGGAERVLLQTVQRLDPAIFESTIVSLRKRGALSREAERSGVETIYLNMGRRPGPVTLFRLAGIFRRRGFGVVHAYLYDASIASRIAGWIASVPVVLTSTRASLEYLPRVAWWLDRVTARWCQRVVAVSRGTAEFVIGKERIPEHKVVVIPNGVDLDHYRPTDRSASREKLSIPAGSFVIASVGRLHEQKGHRFLLKAMSQIRSSIPGLLCLLAGDGPLRDELIGYARDLGISDCCRFLGVLPDSRDVYSAADVLVLASTYEGMPNVVLEAMAMALPVVASRVQGAVDLVRPGETGFLISAGDEVALASRLQECASSPDRWRNMGRRARQVVEAGHGIDQMIAAVETLYLSEWNQWMEKDGRHVPKRFFR